MLGKILTRPIERRQMTNNGPSNTTQKTKYWATLTPEKTRAVSHANVNNLCATARTCCAAHV